MWWKTEAGAVWGSVALFTWGLCASMAAASAADPVVPSDEYVLARQIFRATGIQGGLAVHLGCADGKLTAALGSQGRVLVHGLDRDAEMVQRARQRLHALGLDTRVSVAHWTGDRLPLIDNLVNLVVAQQPPAVARQELLRILAPGGVAYIRRDGQWTKTVKPWPKEIDQWTHFLHDPTGNAVARDTLVGPPRHMQWLAEPSWSRNHHTLASISAVVSAAGRLFYIVDEGPSASMEVPGKWYVVARDAFNGVLLWQRPIPTWAWYRRKFRSGPVQLPRTLVAAGQRVYLPLGVDAPVTALDAATGEIIRTYGDSKAAEEVILDDATLLVVTGSPTTEQAAVDPARSGAFRFPNQKTIVAIRAETGQLLWKWSDPAGSGPVPLTLAAGGGRVLFAAGKQVVCLDGRTGQQRWRAAPAGADRPGQKADRARKGTRRRKSSRQRSLGWSVATLVVRDGVVLWADGRRLSALSAETGATLWSCECRAGFRSPVDVFVARGLVWLGPDFSSGRDLHTGQIRKSNTTLTQLRTAGHHHRCYREKATERYILSGHRGIEFLDLVDDRHSRNNWVRGVCQYGVLPCNGLVYAPSHACGCFMEAKLHGFWALAAENAAHAEGPGSIGQGSESAARFEPGPAYAGRHNARSAIGRAADWPMYRHDALRSGSTTADVPAQLRSVWQTDVGGRLSAPVIADGTVVLSAVDARRVVALDARGGKPRWAFIAGGPVDSPPTVYQGLVLFGAADGWVYCLRLSDGEQVWRFRAAPRDLKTVALDQLQSVWPVHGSVLIQDDVAYVAAGRSSYLDDGIFLWGLDPCDGTVLCQGRVRSEHPKLDTEHARAKATDTMARKIGQNAVDYKTFTAPDKSDAFSMEGATTDILVGDGRAIYLRQLRLDRSCRRQAQQGRHLFSTSSLLDGAENHRSHWVLGVGDFRRIPVAYSWIANARGGRNGVHLAVPYGLMLAFDDETVWGVRRAGSGTYLLFAETNRPFSAGEQPRPDFRPRDGRRRSPWKWSVPLAMRPRAMLRAGKQLLLGGMPLAAERTERIAAYQGRRGGLLWAASAADGTKLAEQKLPAPPVWDGMAAAGGRLYISTCSGSVLCLGGRDRPGATGSQ